MTSIAALTRPSGAKVPLPVGTTMDVPLEIFPGQQSLPVAARPRDAAHAPAGGRELARAGLLQSDRIAPYCWTPSRRVRRHLSEIGFEDRPEESATADMSQDIYRFVCRQIGDDKARFHGDFDLPLQLWIQEHTGRSSPDPDMLADPDDSEEEEDEYV